MLDNVYAPIDEALDQACPMTQATQLCRGNPLFTKHLECKRNVRKYWQNMQNL